MASKIQFFCAARLRLSGFALFLLPGIPILHAAESTQVIDEDLPTVQAEERRSSVFGLGWLDSTQSYASNSANSLANQLDRFLGAQRSDIDAAYSALRLTSLASWNDLDGFDSGIRLRGKVYLPRLNERISLIFTDEAGDNSSYYAEESASIAQEETTRANLEVALSEENAHRLSFRVGMRSGLKGTASIRYRYEPVTESNTVNRLTQTLYYKGGLGFGTFTRYQVDHILDPTSLLRWTNDIRFEESFTGAEYTSTFELLQLRSNNTAMSWYVRVNGETKPDFVGSYDLGFRIRKNISREWLFLEIEPGYTWRKEGFTLARQESPYIILRLEMAIGSYE